MNEHEIVFITLMFILTWIFFLAAYLNKITERVNKSRPIITLESKNIDRTIKTIRTQIRRNKKAALPHKRRVGKK